MLVYIVAVYEKVLFATHNEIDKIFKGFVVVWVDPKSEKAKLLRELSSSKQNETFILYPGMNPNTPTILTSDLHNNNIMTMRDNIQKAFNVHGKNMNVPQLMVYIKHFLRDVKDTSNIVTPNLKMSKDDFIKKFSRLINNEKWRSVGGRISRKDIGPKIHEIINNSFYAIKIVTFFLTDDQSKDVLEFIKRFESCDHVQHIVFGPKIENLVSTRIVSYDTSDIKIADINDYRRMLGFKDEDIPCSVLYNYKNEDHILKCTKLNDNISQDWIDFASEEYLVDVDSTIVDLFDLTIINGRRTLFDTSFNERVSVITQCNGDYINGLTMEISKLKDWEWLFVYMDCGDDKFLKFVKNTILPKEDIQIAKVVSIEYYD